PHAPYSPDLAPSDYFLFPNLKKWLSGQRFPNDEEVMSAVNGYFWKHPRSSRVALGCASSLSNLLCTESML
ncbi:hypothetical protein NL478_28070, partial [Klebsiella pneumoniae]|nr:hypothetical protein [Klebsiella pneumoniae]